MNEFQITNARFIDSRLSDLEEIASGNSVSSPEVKIQNAKAFQGDAGIDWSIFAFGYSISGAKVTVNSGKVRHGTRAPFLVDSKVITIVADQTWIYVPYTFGSTAEIKITSSLTEPITTEQVYNQVLYLVTLSAGTASIGTGGIKHLGDIFIPGVYA